MKISVVTSLYRSAPYVRELYHRCLEAIGKTGADDYEIILVNDHSPDDDLAIAKDLASRDAKVVVIDLSRNFGQHKALLTGLAQASGDYTFMMDSDLEEDPEWLARFHVEMQRTGCDVVFGVQQGEKGSRFYRLGRWVFYNLMNQLSDINLPKNAVTARLMSRRYLDALLEYQEREMFLAGICHVVGFAQLPVDVIKHDTSPTTYSLAHVASIFVNAVTAFTIRPLIAISLIGMSVMLLAFGFTAWVIFRKIAYGVAVQGWASAMVAILMIGGMTLFLNGVIAIYIAKIFLEVKQRPMTTIREVYRTDLNLVGAGEDRGALEAGA
jgi:putative glycosyltransferase